MDVSVELVVEGQVANGGKNNPGKKYKLSMSYIWMGQGLWGRRKSNPIRLSSKAHKAE